MALATNGPASDGMCDFITEHALVMVSMDGLLFVQTACAAHGRQPVVRTVERNSRLAGGSAESVCA
jgi:hypothetical protein